ncbi:hypothetical protein ACQP1W_43210 [Spirillospora sp. CA-255316]
MERRNRARPGVSWARSRARARTTTPDRAQVHALPARSLPALLTDVAPAAQKARPARP